MSSLLLKHESAECGSMQIASSSPNAAPVSTKDRPFLTITEQRLNWGGVQCPSLYDAYLCVSI